jgi:hypothetical protein
MTELEQLKKRVEQLEKQIGTKSTEKPMKRWKPAGGEGYICIYASSDIANERNMNLPSDKSKIKFGNAFPMEMREYLQSDHVKLIQFHNEMAIILWQIDRKNMGKKGTWGMYECGSEKNLKQRIAFQYSFTEKETAELAWKMLSDEIKEWLTT